ncbi:MAG: hypothetical protein M5R36_04665 [Deltaproteobacteria bacterium]|nr:hypothetical protein [Deltaproteobacteria bacterium]
MRTRWRWPYFFAAMLLIESAAPAVARAGNIAWERTYDGPDHRYDYSVAAIGDGEDGVVLAGYSSETTLWGTPGNFVTLRYSPGGDLLWEATDLAGNYWDEIVAAAMDGAGNVIVTGTTYRYFGQKDFSELST